jgi:phage baseplate assembly protein W
MNRRPASGSRGQLGQGLAFPPRIDAEGRLQRSANDDNVREHLRIILTTERDQRLGLPDFGASLGQFLFEPNTTTTHQLVRGRIEQALARWEPRIRLQSVDVQPDDADPLTARVTIHYRLVATDQAQRLALSLTLGGT